MKTNRKTGGFNIKFVPPFNASHKGLVEGVFMKIGLDHCPIDSNRTDSSPDSTVVVDKNPRTILDLYICRGEQK